MAYQERRDGAPRSAKPKASLRSSLQRLKRMGEIENTGPNHCRLRSAEAERTAENTLPASLPMPESAPPISAPVPAVMTSATRFGSTPVTDR